MCTTYEFYNGRNEAVVPWNDWRKTQLPEENLIHTLSVLSIFSKANALFS
jgi:hypothetical protein